MTEAYAAIPLAAKYYGKIKNGKIIQYGAQIPFNFELISKTHISTTSSEFQSHIMEWINSMPIGNLIHANWVVRFHLILLRCVV